MTNLMQHIMPNIYFGM